MTPRGNPKASYGQAPALRRASSLPAGHPGQESLYLRFLSEQQVQVHVKLRDGEVVCGWIVYFDEQMIRLTREGKPNLFIYKEQIHTISEFARKDEGRRRAAERKAANVTSTQIAAIEGAQ